MGDHLLAWGQPFGGAGALGHPDGSEEAGEDGDQALEEEDVAPGVDGYGISSPARDAGEACCEKTTEGASYRVC